MDQTTELLNSLTEDEVAKYATNSNSEEHIVIGADRKITVPSSLKRLAVQFDHNVETVTFDAPRYWDGIDMATSEFVTYINYILPDQTMGAYVAKNVRVNEADDSVMHFDWTIENNITVEKGTIVFLVCHKKLGQTTKTYEQTVYDEDGNPVLNEDGTEQTVTVTETEDVLVTHWNSEPCKECYISEGMECDEAVLEMYPDVLTQVLLAINRFEGMEVTQFVQRLEGIENDISENDSAIQVLEGKVDDLEKGLGDIPSNTAAALEELTQQIATNSTNISELNTEVEDLQQQTNDLQDAVDNISYTSTSRGFYFGIDEELIITGETGNPNVNTVYDTGFSKYVLATIVAQNNTVDPTFRLYGEVNLSAVPTGEHNHVLTMFDLSQISRGLIANYKNVQGSGYWISRMDNKRGYARFEVVPGYEYDDEPGDASYAFRFYEVGTDGKPLAAPMSLKSLSDLSGYRIEFDISGVYGTKEYRIHSLDYKTCRVYLGTRTTRPESITLYGTTQGSTHFRSYATVSWPSDQDYVDINLATTSIITTAGVHHLFISDGTNMLSNQIEHVVRPVEAPTMEYDQDTGKVTLYGPADTQMFRLYGLEEFVGSTFVTITDIKQSTIAGSYAYATYDLSRHGQGEYAIYATALVDGRPVSDPSETYVFEYYN